MATCPHCGDSGAPDGGTCLLCGGAVPHGDGPSIGTPPTAPPAHRDPLSEEPTAAVPAPAPPAGPPPPLPVPDAAPPPERRVPRTRTRTTPTTSAALSAARRVGTTQSSARPRTGLSVTSRNEYSSVPSDDPPVVGVLVEIEASGRPLVRRGAGPVAHVVLTLDVSASMNHPKKYPVLRAAIASMLDDLQGPGAADVLLSVVIFSKGSETLFRAVPARDVNQAALFRGIEHNPLCFARYTDIGGALSRAGRIAYDQARDNADLPIRIYVLTDGKPQDAALARKTAERVAKIPADVHGLAFGPDADVSVLQRLFAGRRGGTVKSVRRETIGSAFERVAEVAQRVVATRARVQFDLAPGVVGGDAYRYRPARVRFPQPAFHDGKRFRTDLGTIEKGRTYSLLFEIRPPETYSRVSPIGELHVQVPDGDGFVTEVLEIELPRTESGAELGDLDRGVRTARDILSALSHDDPATALRALRLRRQLYEQERRDPGLLSILDKAIHLLENEGSLESLSPGDYATLLAHTCTGSS